MCNNCGKPGHMWRDCFSAGGGKAGGGKAGGGKKRGNGDAGDEQAKRAR